MAKRSKARTEFLNDIVVTAAEGGVNHWANSIDDYKKVDRGDGIEHYSFIVHYDDPSEDAKRAQFVDEELIASGLNKLLRGEKVNAEVKSFFREASKENDAGMLDAEDASALVEWGIWGEFVFA